MWLVPIWLHVQLTGKKCNGGENTLLKGTSSQSLWCNSRASVLELYDYCDSKWCAGNKQNKRLVPHKSGSGLNADRGADTPTSAMPVHAHYFIFLFFIQHTGVDISESSHACYCFSTTPRLPGTFQFHLICLNSSAPLSFYNLPFFSSKCAKVWATSCFIPCGLTKWISLISRERWLALFWRVDWWLAKTISTVTHCNEEGKRNLRVETTNLR